MMKAETRNYVLCKHIIPTPAPIFVAPALMSVQEIIDLTTESPVPLAIDALDSSANQSRDSRKLKRKKKSSNSKSSSTGAPEVPSSLSLSDSNERSAKLDHSTKRKRISETPEPRTKSNERHSHKRDDSGEPNNSDSAGLFFVDLSPAIIPSVPVSNESLSTTNAENKTVEKLLLPPHVSVFGNTLVEIISQPLSDSDDEFIKYLDYEDTRVCTWLLFCYFHSTLSSECATILRWTA